MSFIHKLDPERFFNFAGPAWLAQQPQSVFFETTRPDAENFRSYLFLHPLRVVQCHSLQEIASGLHQIQQALQAGYYAAGFLSYEAGYAFEPRLHANVSLPVPLLWFGIYAAPFIYNHRQGAWETGAEEISKIPCARAEQSPEAMEAIALTPTLSEAEYSRALTAIKNYIAAGDTYQVNFTFKLKFPFAGSPAALYCRLRQKQRTGYSALLACGEHTILSFSPELFFRVEDDKITLKPMKGTAPRGDSPEEDGQQRQALLYSEKNRAENLMIVDMLRNDVGRIARTGSVQAPRLFELEPYETVWQATSTITAKLRPRATVPELMRCLFPCGSVTGAPKIRTMQIIRELEREPRGIYTGCLGFFSPQKEAVFNVAIRTLVLNRSNGTGEMGVGSGVVWDSEAAAEYHECLLKAKFLSEARAT